MAASDRPGQAAAAIKALGEYPSPSDARRALAEFDAKDLAAALVAIGTHKTARVVVESADILSMSSSPIVLIAAPEPGEVIVPLRVRSRCGAGTTSYTSYGTVYVRTAMTDLVADGLGFMLGSTPNPVTNADMDGGWRFGGGVDPVNPETLRLTSDADPVDGDFDIALEIDYVVVPAAAVL